MSDHILVDVDPGCDDATMLAMALASNDVDLVGVTTVAGNAALPDTTTNALWVLELFDRSEIPVVPGCDRPLVEPLDTAEEIHGRGGLPGNRPTPSTEPTDDHAVSFILEQSRKVDDLTILATGPLTNLAVAMAIDPALPERLGALYVMGGAFEVEGNASNVSEYNFYADPAAAARVVRDGTPRIVSLDVTHRATLRPETIESLQNQSDIARQVAGWLAYRTPAAVRQHGVPQRRPQHDPTVLIDFLSGVLVYERASLEVDHGTGPSRGELRRSEQNGENAMIATDIDVEAFRTAIRHLLDRL